MKPVTITNCFQKTGFPDSFQETTDNNEKDDLSLLELQALLRQAGCDLTPTECLDCDLNLPTDCTHEKAPCQLHIPRPESEEEEEEEINTAGSSKGPSYAEFCVALRVMVAYTKMAGGTFQDKDSRTKQPCQEPGCKKHNASKAN